VWIVACDGSVSGAAVRAAVKNRPDAASASIAGAVPTPTRSARSVSIVTSRTFGRGAATRARQPPGSDAEATMKTESAIRGPPRRPMRPRF